MSSDVVLRILREGLYTALLLSAGPLAVATVVGIFFSLIQATTSLQEQTLSYVPKLLAVSLTVAILAPWMLGQAVQFTRTMFDMIPLIK